MGNRCVTTASFAKEVDDLFNSFISVARYPDNGRLLHCLLTSTIKRMEYWISAVDKVATWTFRKLKFLDTRNLRWDALVNTFGTIRLQCGSKNNTSVALKTVIINGLAYRSLYGTNWEGDGTPLLNNCIHFTAIHCFMNQYIDKSLQWDYWECSNVHIGREALRGVSAAVGACDKKMFSVADVNGLVRNMSFGCVVSRTTFYRKLLITCRVIKVITLYVWISR